MSFGDALLDMYRAQRGTKRQAATGSDLNHRQPQRPRLGGQSRSNGQLTSASDEFRAHWSHACVGTAPLASCPGRSSGSCAASPRTTITIDDDNHAPKQIAAPDKQSLRELVWLSGLRTIPNDYQIDGLIFAIDRELKAGKGGLISWDMGLGKTLEAIMITLCIRLLERPAYMVILSLLL